MYNLISNPKAAWHALLFEPGDFYRLHCASSCQPCVYTHGVAVYIDGGNAQYQKLYHAVRWRIA